MNLLVAFNAAAASGRSGRKRAAVREAVLREHPGSEFLHARDAHDLRERLARANLEPFDGVIAAGGDGTLFQVLNGLYANPERRPLGLIPLGTGNAFAREFGLLPSAWKTAVARLAEGRTRRVDVGRVEWSGGVYYFLNIVGIGFAVDAGLAARKLKFAGRSAYTLGALWRMLRLRSYPLDMRLDGERVQQDNVFVEVSNSRFTGTSFLMAPGAELDDGLLDVTWLSRVPRLRLAWLFRSIFSGRHVGYPEVETRQAREIQLDAPTSYLLMPDGEFEGRTPARISCLRRDLELFC